MKCQSLFSGQNEKNIKNCHLLELSPSMLSVMKKKNCTFFFSEKVAPHMKLRGGIEFIDEIPKNPAGKILRQKLRQKVLGDLNFNFTQL